MIIYRFSIIFFAFSAKIELLKCWFEDCCRRTIPHSQTVGSMEQRRGPPAHAQHQMAPPPVPSTAAKNTSSSTTASGPRTTPSGTTTSPATSGTANATGSKPTNPQPTTTQPPASSTKASTATPQKQDKSSPTTPRISIMHRKEPSLFVVPLAATTLKCWPYATVESLVWLETKKKQLIFQTKRQTTTLQRTCLTMMLIG